MFSKLFPAVALSALLVIGTPTLQAGSKGSGSKGGSSSKGGKNSKNSKTKHDKHEKHHHHTVPQKGEAPWQKVRYFAVSNETGQDIRVYVKCSDGETRYWDLAADKKSYLAIDDEKIVASELCVWATSEGRNWMTYQNESLNLVPESYRSHSIGTYTFSFR